VQRTGQLSFEPSAMGWLIGAAFSDRAAALATSCDQELAEHTSALVL
jgi:hypothetical protein